MAVGSEKFFGLNENACGLVLRVASQRLVQAWARIGLCGRFRFDRTSRGAKPRSSDVGLGAMSGGPPRVSRGGGVGCGPGKGARWRPWPPMYRKVSYGF